MTTSRQSLLDMWAGMVTAVVFYAEYVGLSTSMNEVLSGEGPGQSPALVLILISVAFACLLCACSGRAMLAGPRAASLATLVFLMSWLKRAQAFGTEDAALCVALMGLSAAAIHAGAGHRAVFSFVSNLPQWLIEGFYLATAASIVAGSGVAGILRSCSASSEIFSWSVFSFSVLLGIVWKQPFEKLYDRAQLGRSATNFFKGLAIPVGMAAAWFAQGLGNRAPEKTCGRIGDTAFHWPFVVERIERVWQTAAAGSFPLSLALYSVGLGLLLGIVLAIESTTTLLAPQSPVDASASDPKLEKRARPEREMTLVAIATGALSALAAAPVSVSKSRTAAVQTIGAIGPLAPLTHGATLLLVAAFAAPYLAFIPKLAAGVALALVAVQMLSKTTYDMWGSAHRPNTPPGPSKDVLSGFLLIGVVAATLALNSALWGLSIGFGVHLASEVYTFFRKKWSRNL